MTNPDRGALEGLKINRAPARARRVFPWWILLVIAGMAVAGVWWFKAHSGSTVEFATARSESVSSASSTSAGETLLNASGYVTARRAATVAAKVTGKVIEILVEEGMRIEEGQILARLDNSNAMAGLRLAEARLEATRLTLAETGPTLTFARQELERFLKLRDSNAASVSDLARAESEVAALRAREARQAADIRVGERQVDELKQQLDDTIIRAPFSGVVTTKDAQPGEIISPMASGGFTRTGVCTVVDMTSLEIEVDVNESYLNRVQNNMPAEATLDAYADWKIPCKVIAIIPTADRQKATVKVRIGFEKLDARILPDMGVKVAFFSMEKKPDPSAPAATAAQVIVIPTAAITEVNERRILWVVKSGKAERRAVQTAQVSGSDTVITAGLSIGEKVIINPEPTLTDGATVRE